MIALLLLVQVIDVPCGTLRIDPATKSARCIDAPGPVPSPTPTPVPTPTPTPKPTPTPTPGALCSCPGLARWGLAKPGSSSSKWLGKNGQQVSGPQVGGAGYFDSVERFGSGNGVPCDDDHLSNCQCADGQKPLCEDPRGPIWSLSGPGTLAVEGEWGFQAKVKMNSAGHFRLQVCPRSDLQDRHGRPVPLTPGSCGVFEWDAR